MTPDAPLAEGRGLRVSFSGRVVLRGVDITVRPGETVALLGGNGSGKSTLIRTLLGLVPRDAGDVDLFGTPLTRFTSWHRLGYVPQRHGLQVSNATVGEVVASGRVAHRRPLLPARASDRRAISNALNHVDLADRRHDRYSTLSGGQQQRTLIGRGLASEPDLLILDEPLAALDMGTQRSLTHIFRELKESGLGMLVVLHELGPLEKLIDRSVVLRDGEVIHDGPLLAGIGDGGHHHDSPSPGGLLDAPELNGRSHR